MTETPREVRENLIMQWYEMKLNRDELLRVLGGVKSIDKESRERIEKEIMENFYANYERAKAEKQGYQRAEELYRGKGDTKGIKWIQRNLVKKTGELIQKEESIKGELDEIFAKKLDVSEVATELETGGWLKRSKLKKTKQEWNDLKKREKTIKDEIGELSKEKRELEAELNRQETQYGSKIDRRQIRKTGDLYEGMNIGEVRGESTLKGYKDKYEKMLKDKEEYKEKFLEEMEKMDIGITGDKKKEIMSKIQKGLDEDLENLKEGDELLKMAREVSKWLEENDSKNVERISELSKEIDKKNLELKRLEKMEEGRDVKEILTLRKQEFGVQTEINDLSEERDLLKAECDEKYRVYYGITYEKMQMIRENRMGVETLVKAEVMAEQLKHGIGEIKSFEGGHINKEQGQTEDKGDDRMMEGRRVEEKKVGEEKANRERSDKQKLHMEKFVEEAEDCKFETLKILAPLRDWWKENLLGISSEVKQKIFKEVKKIPIKAVEEQDGSRLIEFGLGGKIYKFLDVNVPKHSDETFLEESVYVYKNREKGVAVEGMLGDDIDSWRNKKLKKYIKDKEKLGLFMPKPEEMVILLKELGKQAGLDAEEDQIAMLAYLTGIRGDYWLQAMNNESARMLISCHSWSYFITSNRSHKFYAYLCLISLDR